MKKDTFFDNITENERKEATQKIVDSSCSRKSFFVMTIAAAVISTIGILENNGANGAVIIGGILMVPLLSLILAILIRMIMTDFCLIYRSISTFLKAVIFSFFFSIFFTFIFKHLLEFNHEMMIWNQVNLEAIILSLLIGILTDLSIARKEFQQYLMRTVIAISFISPISMSTVALKMHGS